MFAYIMLTSVALSIDALGIGISYRMNGIRIPLRSKFIIGLVTVLIMFMALMVGTMLNMNLPANLAEYLGAGILLILGILLLRKSIRQKEDDTYDFDHSREIEPGEGFLLAIALSTDSIGVGIGVASSGIGSCVLGVTTGIMQLFFLYLAEFLVGHMKTIGKYNQKVCGICSGVLLIMIGILQGIL